MRLGFAYWVSRAPSGGNRYDAEVLAGLRRLGVEVTAVQVRADPEVGPGVEAELRAVLPRERLWLVDAIVATAAPDVIAAATAAGARVTVLVHHFEADVPGRPTQQRERILERERRVLTAATGVLCTSVWARAALQQRYGIDAVAAAPGVDPAPVAPGSRAVGAPRLLTVGSLTPVKDQLTLAVALGRLRDVAWTARFVGADDADPRYAVVLRRAVADAQLSDRIALVGARTGPALDAEWAAADLLVHPSRTETYGLVVLEALARGVPAVVTARTGLVEALQAGRRPGDPLAGAVVEATQPDELAAVLRRWCVEDAQAARWRSAALQQRDRLPSWSQTAARVLACLRTLPTARRPR